MRLARKGRRPRRSCRVLSRSQGAFGIDLFRALRVLRVTGTVLLLRLLAAIERVLKLRDTAIDKVEKTVDSAEGRVRHRIRYSLSMRVSYCFGRLTRSICWTAKNLLLSLLSRIIGLEIYMDTPHDAPTSTPLKSGPATPEKTSPLLDTSTSTWLTREESAHLLGVGVQTVKSYEKKGLLLPARVPRRDIKGREQVVVVYDPRELVKVRAGLEARTKQSSDDDTSTWLTRNECIDVMNIARQTLKNYERQGLLHPKHVPRRDARGHEQYAAVYNPKELSKLPRGVGRAFAPREIGEMTARCFELFDQGKTFREIVIQLRQTSDKIHELHEKWLDDGGADFVITPQAREALEAVLGPFADVAELVSLVTARGKVS